MDINNITMQDAVKIYKMMRFLDNLECQESIKTIYSDLYQKGFYFSLFDHEPKQIHEDDCDYKFIEVRYTLSIVKHSKNNEITESKQLKKWWDIYCMTIKDITYNEFREENVWTSDSNCDVGGILNACDIKIDRLSYFK